MARKYMVSSCGVAERFSDAIARLRSPGDYVVVVRGVPRAVVMSCPDGCGETLTVNLDRRTGPAWRKYDRENKLTIYPSVWRESGCGAHFIVWRDQIIWCGIGDNSGVSIDDGELLAQIHAKLDSKNFMHYESIADAIQQIPWDVYWACKDLVRAGKALEGKAGTFRRTEHGGGIVPSGNQGIDTFA